MGQIRNRKPIDMMGYEFQTWKVIALSNKKVRATINIGHASAKFVIT